MLCDRLFRRTSKTVSAKMRDGNQDKLIHHDIHHLCHDQRLCRGPTTCAYKTADKMMEQVGAYIVEGIPDNPGASGVQDGDICPQNICL